MTCTHKWSGGLQPADGSQAGGLKPAAPLERCPACLLEVALRDDDDFEPGTILGGRFRLVAPLGHGGMGDVYRADDLKIGHPVALKFTTGMLSEVRVGREVAHPNVCRMYDVVDLDDCPAIVMEFIDGQDLGRFQPAAEQALRIARDVCAGLQAIHEKGIVHGDLKPANVMIDADGRAHITDFGLSAHAGDAARFGGTPAYLAPEQRASRTATQRSDLYALGVLLAELLPPELPVIERCLRPDPDARPASAAEVLAALDDAGALALHVTTRFSKLHAWLAAAATGVALVLLLVLSRDASRLPPGPRALHGDVYLAVLTAALIAGAVLAWRNLRERRVDRRGAGAAALLVFVCRAASGVTHLPQTVEEAAAFASSLLAASLLLAAEVWVAYVALEPYVRRTVPDALVSWSRLVRGRLRDPLVARDLLLGALAGVAARLLSPAIVAFTLQAASYALARAVFYALFGLLLLVLLRVVTRSAWAAALVWLAATAAIWRRWEVVVILVVLDRLGFLAAAVAIFALIAGSV